MILLRKLFWLLTELLSKPEAVSPRLTALCGGFIMEFASFWNKSFLRSAWLSWAAAARHCSSVPIPRWPAEATSEKQEIWERTLTLPWLYIHFSPLFFPSPVITSERFNWNVPWLSEVCCGCLGRLFAFGLNAVLLLQGESSDSLVGGHRKPLIQRFIKTRRQLLVTTTWYGREEELVAQVANNDQ